MQYLFFEELVPEFKSTFKIMYLMVGTIGQSLGVFLQPVPKIWNFSRYLNVVSVVLILCCGLTRVDDMFVGGQMNQQFSHIRNVNLGKWG